MKKHNKQKSFTLIELMTVIGIIAILAGLMLVGYNVFFSEANIGSSMRFDSSIHHSLGYALVGDWKMDDNAANSTVVDSSGNGNDGTFYSDGSEDNTANHSVDGANGRALEFDGVDDYVEIKNSSTDLKGNKAFTYSVWLKKEGDNGYSYQSIITKSSDSDNQKQLHVFNDGRLQGHIDQPEGGTTVEYLISDDKWYYAVMAYNGNNLTLYINGNLKDSSAVSMDVLLNTANLNISGIDYTSGWYFKGKLDQIRIYQDVFSAIQIKQQYYTGLQRLYEKNMISEKEYKERIRHF